MLRRLLGLRLSPLVLAVAIVSLALSFGTAVAARYWLVLPKLQQLEAASDRKDLRRVLMALDAKKLQLSTMAYQNAVWDDMYGHVERPDTEFFDRTFPLETLVNLSIDEILLFNRERQLIDQRLIDKQQTALVTARPLLTAVIPTLIDLNQVKDHAPIFDSGFLTGPEGPCIYAVAGVMRSDATGSAHGNLFIASRMDSEFLRDVADSAQIPVRIAPLTSSDRQARPLTVEQVLRDDNNQLTWLLIDSQKHPIVKLILSPAKRSYYSGLWSLPLQVVLLATLLCALLTVLVLQSAVVRPLRALGGQLRQVTTSNDYSKRLDTHRTNELGDLSRDIDALIQHVQRQQQLLQALSFEDGLTGLANRRRFDQMLADTWALGTRAHFSLALIMIDVDYFKLYNDHYGHQHGDQLLIQLAAILQRMVRQTDLAARYGGEEFVLVLPQADIAGAEKIAVRLQSELNRAQFPHASSPIGGNITLSMGIVATTPSAEQTLENFVRSADEALYGAKAAGRNRIMLAAL